MGKRLTFEEAKKRFEEKGYVVISNTYKTNHDKFLLTDKDGYMYEINVNNLKKYRERHYPFVKFNSYIMYNIQKYLDNMNSGIKVISSEYNGNQVPITLKCKCGNIFQSTFADILCRNRLLCTSCLRKNSSRRIKQEEAFSRLKSKGLFPYKDQHYKNNSQKILCLNNEGYKVYATLEGLNKSPLVFSLIYNKENYIYNINRFFVLNNIPSRALEINKNSKGETDVIVCECKCGNLYTTSIDAIKKIDIDVLNVLKQFLKLSLKQLIG